MDKYFQNLLIQFQNATGIYDISSPENNKEFANWVARMDEAGEKYTTFLDNYDVNFEDETVAEIGKGGYNSVVIPFDTTIITDVPSTFKNIDESRLIDGRPIIEKDGLYILSQDKKRYKINTLDRTIDTIMTQNPVNYRQINGLDYLHNKKLNNIIVGIYGKKNDLDIAEKIQMLKQLKKLLEDYSYSWLEDENKDDYYFAVVSDRIIKAKNKLWDESLYYYKISNYGYHNDMDVPVNLKPQGLTKKSVTRRK